jgi:hypothetical protein
MKKLIIAALILLCYNQADFALRVPVKKSGSSKMSGVKKVTDNKEQAKREIFNKREQLVTLIIGVTVIFATVFFVVFFAGIIYGAILLAECVGGIAALFIFRQPKVQSPTYTFCR